jgi:hypothetical protein
MKLDRKIYWSREEIEIGNHLMSFAEGIRNDFMKGFNNLTEAAEAHCVNVIDPSRHEVDSDGHNDHLVSRDPITKEWKPKINAWQAVGFKFTRYDDRKVVSYKITEEQAKNHPTAYKLLQEYDHICPMMSLNVMHPYTILHRHTGPENREGKFVRIHIPVIVPEGDIFLETYGKEITWDDLFAFDNTLTHSAHNYSNEPRLIVLIDIDREAIGLGPGFPYDEQLDKNAPPFIRGKQR